MFYGHIGVGLAAKSVAPKASLGVLLVASEALDTLCGVLTMAGIERMSPVPYIAWSHGLFMSAVWALVGGVLAFVVSRDRRTSVVLGLVVFSHWVLDWISHPMFSDVPDLPLLFGGSPLVGLGLYKTLPGALLIELGLLAAGTVIYLVATRANDRTGVWAFALMMAFLAIMPLGTALPERLAVLPTFAVVLLLPLGNWVERHRSLKRQVPASETRVG